MREAKELMDVDASYYDASNLVCLDALSMFDGGYDRGLQMVLERPVVGNP